MVSHLQCGADAVTLVIGVQGEFLQFPTVRWRLRMDSGMAADAPIVLL